MANGKPGRPRKATQEETRSALLWSLFDAFTEACVDLVKAEEVSAAHLDVVRKFLDDNNVRCDVRALRERAFANTGTSAALSSLPYPLGLVIPAGGEH